MLWGVYVWVCVSKGNACDDDVLCVVLSWLGRPRQRDQSHAFVLPPFNAYTTTITCHAAWMKVVAWLHKGQVHGLLRCTCPPLDDRVVIPLMAFISLAQSLILASAVTPFTTHATHTHSTHNKYTQEERRKRRLLLLLLLRLDKHSSNSSSSTTITMPSPPLPLPMPSTATPFSPPSPSSSPIPSPPRKMRQGFGKFEITVSCWPVGKREGEG